MQSYYWAWVGLGVENAFITTRLKTFAEIWEMADREGFKPKQGPSIWMRIFCIYFVRVRSGADCRITNLFDFFGKMVGDAGCEPATR